MPLPGDPESINAYNNRLRLGGRSDEGGQITNSSFRHPELDSGSIKIGKDSGSEAGMTGTESNILHRKVQSDEGNRMPRTPSRHSDGSQSLSMPINLIRHFCQQTSRKAAFTMAEVLITLGIIGIVAAMTLPSLIGKWQKKVTIANLKKSYTILSQLVLRSQEDNGPAFLASNKVDAKTTEVFFYTYWLPYFNSPTVGINKLYTTSTPYKTLTGDIENMGVYTSYEQGRLLFSTLDGTTYYVLIMAWKAEHDEDGNFISQTAVYTTSQKVYVDLNGPKPPNTYGKDVFLFTVDFDKNIVRPAGYMNTENQINSNCSLKGSGNTCAAKIIRDGWEIRNDYPW